MPNTNTATALATTKKAGGAIIAPMKTHALHPTIKDTVYSGNRNRTYNALRALAKNGAIIFIRRGDIAPTGWEQDEMPVWMRLN